jgi:hypothetical protein
MTSRYRGGRSLVNTGSDRLELVEAAMQGFDYDAFYAREEQIMAMEDAAYERTKWPERAKRGRGPSAWHT